MPLGVPAAARRLPRRRGRGGVRLPPRPRVGDGRLPRRRHVLRPVGVPHHLAAAQRVRPRQGGVVHLVLGPPRPPPAPGALRRADRGRRLRRVHRRLVDARRPAQRHVRHALLRRELALHRLGPVVLRTLQRSVAAAARVVAGDRGAVLPGVAADRVRLPAPRARAAAACSPGCASPARSRRRCGWHGSTTAPTSPVRTTAPTRARSCSSSVRSSRSCSPRWSPQRPGGGGWRRRPPASSRSASSWRRSSSSTTPTRSCTGAATSSFAVAVSLLITSVIQPQHTVLRAGLSLAPVVWLGRISYGIYLWHWPAIVILSPERTGIEGVPSTSCVSPSPSRSRPLLLLPARAARARGPAVQGPPRATCLSRRVRDDGGRRDHRHPRRHTPTRLSPVRAHQDRRRRRVAAAGTTPATAS